MKRIFLIILIAINILHLTNSQSCSSVDEATLTLSTLNGQIKGQCVNAPVSYADNYKGQGEVLLWQSVPYAQAPIGQNRFKAPVPAGQWDHIIDGTKPAKSCLQLDDPFGNTSEDCLYLSIYVNKNSYLKRDTELKPIIVWIHGGGFAAGSANLYNGTTVVSMSDVIMVTINYRLNALGFLHVAGTDVTGNQGLLDTQLALKWVSENAKNFGGDNTKITISGESAGAWNVGFQLFMEPSWPHFRNAIMQSGGVTGKNNFYRLLRSDEATSRAKVFFYYLRCLESTDSLSLECAQRRSSDEILEAYNLVDDFFRKQEGSKILFSAYVPVIDNIVFSKPIPELSAEKAFKNCSVMTGYNSDEFALFALFYYDIFRNDSSKFLEEAQNFDSNDFSMALEDIFKYYPIYPYKDMLMFSSIFHEYLTPSELHSLYTLAPDQLLKKLTQIVSDNYFACQSYQLASLYSGASNRAFVYDFDYRMTSSAIPESIKGFFGAATHGDELIVTFAGPLNPEYYQTFSQAERDFTQKVVFYWTNFVKYDDPSEVTYDSVTTWLPFTNKKLVQESDIEKTGQFLVMNNDKIAMKAGFTSHHCKFWGY